MGQMPLPKKIVLFDQFGFVGGGQSVLLALVEAAGAVFQQVTVAIIPSGSLEDSLRARFQEKISIVPTPELRMKHGQKGVVDSLLLVWHCIAFVVRHWRLARSSDFLYANGARQFPALMLLSVLANRYCCYHVHIDHTRVEKRVIALAAKLWTTARVVVNSTFIYRRLIDVCPSLSGPKVIVLENGLGSEYEGRRFVDRFSSLPSQWNIVVLGVLRPEKGQDVAIELARRNALVHLHLIGRVGDGAEQWVRRIKEESPSNVTFHNPVSDVPAMLDRIGAHIILVPSQWDEPFGLVAIEGMACSCITLVRASGALPEIATKTGAIVYGSTVEDLIGEINRLMKLRDDALSELARRQYDATMAEYSPRQFLKRMVRMMAALPSNPSCE